MSCYHNRLSTLSKAILKSPLNLQTISDDLLPESFRSTSSSPWMFHLLDINDLSRAVDLVTECFYKPRFKLNTDDMTSIEKYIWQSVFGAYNNIDKFEFNWNNKWGIRSRGGHRLKYPSLELSKDAFILIATPSISLNQRDSTNSTTSHFLDKHEIAGMIEISLEDPNGKLADAIPSPLRGTTPPLSDEPYLCNLCVSPNFRRQGLGTVLCKLAEDLVSMHWSKKKMYLHVETDNTPAKLLYVNMGYTVTKGLSYWEAKFYGQENILYYCKNL